MVKMYLLDLDIDLLIIFMTFFVTNKKKVRESLAEMEKLEKNQLMKVMDIMFD